MVELLHDGNFFAYLVLSAPELVYEGSVGRAGEVVITPEFVETVALVLAAHDLDGLHASHTQQAQRSAARGERRRILTTSM